jgi:hypothetical protein
MCLASGDWIICIFNVVYCFNALIKKVI